MLEIRRLKSCTLEDAVKAWNDGFEGYAFDATTSPDAFLRRMAAEELSSELSLVAFHEGTPAGIVLNGIRETGGQRIGWNGGTGVAAPFRGTGLGLKLIESAFAVLQDNGAELATLEALSGNAPAIALYKKAGYLLYDELEHLSLKGPAQSPLAKPELHLISILPVPLVHLAKVPFYRAQHPWQTHWQSAKEGQAVVAQDQKGNMVGYAYWKKIYNDAGEHTATVMYQCEAAPGNLDAVPILKRLIWEAFGDLQEPINRSIPNLPKNRSALTGLVLKSLGFTTAIEQVYMTKRLQISLSGDDPLSKTC